MTRLTPPRSVEEFLNRQGRRFPWPHKASVAILLLLAGGLLLWLGTPAWRTTPPPSVTRPTLRQAWTERTLLLRPDGCLELQTDRGARTFIYRDRQWRECPRTPARRRGGP